MIKKEQIWEIANEFEERSHEELIAYAINEFNKDIAFACSFGMEDVCIVDMIAKVAPDTNIFYLDTGVFFKETYELIERLKKRYGIKFECVKALMSLEEQADKYGPELWKKDPDLCCKIRKVEPLKRKLATVKAWVTGIRREQAPTRANAKTVEWDDKFCIVKFNPLVRWTAKDVLGYVMGHGIPYNPLHDKGYPSIGCEPCTAPIKAGEDPRSGRWKGFEKKECGLHV